MNTTDDIRIEQWGRGVRVVAPIGKYYVTLDGRCRPVIVFNSPGSWVELSDAIEKWASSHYEPAGG